MGFISGSGIAAAGRTAASVRSIAARLGLAGAALALLVGATPTSELTIDVAALRSSKGSIRLCLTADPAHFPSCVGDADAVTRTVPAAARDIAIAALPHGRYGVAVIHDENNNGKLDTMFGMPREGFGFSRNPPLGFGPPRFAAVRFDLTGDAAVQQIRMRYLL